MALIRLIVPLLASTATVFGLELDWNIVINILLIVFTVLTMGWMWWKNNNVTQAAQEAQLVLNDIKSKYRVYDKNHIEVTE